MKPFLAASSSSSARDNRPFGAVTSSHGKFILISVGVKRKHDELDYGKLSYLYNFLLLFLLFILIAPVRLTSSTATMSLGVAQNPAPNPENDAPFSVVSNDMDERVLKWALNEALR